MSRSTRCPPPPCWRGCAPVPSTAATLLRHGQRNAWIEMVIDEGRNRQIRRIVEAAGARVLRLVRVGIGALPLGELPKGAVRALQPDEIALPLDNGCVGAPRPSAEGRLDG